MEILLSIVVIVLAILYIWYAKIISRRNTAREALAGIDVQLTNRANVIPNILTIAKKFMQHEASLIEEVTKLRTQATSDYNQLDPKAQFITCSGRLNFELVQKVLMTDVGIMIGVGAPTSLAIDLANKFDITLIGFVKRDSFNIYTNNKKVIVD